MALVGGLRAAPPSTLFFQGRLVDPSGQPAKGSVAVSFELAPVGAPGNVLWSEDQALLLDSLGVFSTSLGGTVTWTPGLFDGPLALNLKEQGTGTSLLQEPLALASEPLAYRAAVAESLAPRGDLSMSSFRLTGLADPTLGQDAATRGWVEGLVAQNPTGPVGPTGPMGETSPSIQLHLENSARITNLTTRVADLEAAVAILSSH